MTNEKLQFYVNTLVIETLLSDPRLVKGAQSSGIISSVIQTAYNYIKGKISSFENSQDKVGAIIDFIIPGALSAFGSPLLATITWIAENVFHFSFSAILKDVASEIKNLINGGKQTTTSEVQNAVIKSVVNNMPSAPSGQDTGKASDNIVKQNMTLREAQLYKLSFLNFLDQNPTFDPFNPKLTIKVAAGLLSFIGTRSKLTKIIIAVISWFVTAVLAASGFMVAGDVIHSIVGNISGSGGSAANSSSTSTVSTVSNAPSQTRFKVSQNYNEESYNGPNSRWALGGDVSELPDLIVSWATEIYPDLKGHENEIKSDTIFNDVVNTIKAYNKGGTPGAIFIPTQWHSRKDIVDQFMAELAKNIPVSPQSNPAQSVQPSGSAIKPIPNYTPPTNKPEGVAV